jgi:beta-lactamase superfamily II metal-dependent hydrolase
VILSLVLQGLGLGTFSVNLLSILAKGISWFITKLSWIVMTIPNLWIIPSWTLFAGIFLSSVVLIFSQFSSRKLLKINVLTISVIVFVRICLFYSRSHTPNQTSYPAQKIEQLDVGQGDGALVTAPQAGLIDTGSIRAILDDQWIQIFAKRKIQKIDWVALTHLDEDHAGGLVRLSRLIPIRCISTSSAELDDSKGKKYAQSLSRSSLVISDWSSGCVPYPTLAPTRNSKKKKNKNMGAVWVPLRTSGFYLSAGDADEEDEIRIGNWAKGLSHNRPYPRILKVSHHGSRYSSAPEFLNTLQPTEAWISVGNGNRYGHPSTQTLRKLYHLKIPVLKTDRDGFISTERLQK